MQKKEEEINEKCFERNFNELNEEFSNNNNNRMTNNEEAKALAEQIDNFASSKINKKKEKRITTLVLDTSGGNINKINYIDDKGNNPNIMNNII